MSPQRTNLYTNGVFGVSSLLGLFPLRWVDDRLDLDVPLLVYSIVVAGLLSSVGYYSVQLMHINLGMSYAGTFLAVFVGSLFLTVPTNLAVVVSRRKDVQHIFQILNDLESSFDVPRRNAHIHFVVIMYILVPIIVYGAIQYFCKEDCQLGPCIFFACTLSAKSLVCAQFAFLVNSVEALFDRFVRILREMEISQSSKVKRHRMLQVLSAAVKLTITTYILNAVYSTQLLIILTSCFMGPLIHIFVIYSLLKLPNYQFKSYGISLQFCVLFSLFFIIWNVIRSSSTASDKVG